MTALERYLQELSGALHARGRARRRLLAECRDHLTDATATYGDEEAIRRFGTAAELAGLFDNEIAVRRSVRATIASIVGVFAVGASTVALLNATDARASAVAVWAVIFFASAQTAGISALLATLRAAAMQHRPTSAADLALLCRRNIASLAFSGLALFAAVPRYLVTPPPGRCSSARRWLLSPRSLSCGLVRLYGSSVPIHIGSCERRWPISWRLLAGRMAQVVRLDSPGRSRSSSRRWWSPPLRRSCGTILITEPSARHSPRRGSKGH